jgi:hypothetical protein
MNIEKTLMALRDLEDEFNALEETKKVIDMLHGAFMTLFDSILEGGKNMGEVLVDIVKTMVSQIISEMSRLLITKFVMGILTPGISVGSVPSPLGFAKGGVVPDGYPNDTYPAMLSSGETVIPRRINANMFGPPQSTEKVIFVIKENQLTGILDKSDKRKKLY